MIGVSWRSSASCSAPVKNWLMVAPVGLARMVSVVRTSAQVSKVGLPARSAEAGTTRQTNQRVNFMEIAGQAAIPPRDVEWAIVEPRLRHGGFLHGPDQRVERALRALSAAGPKLTGHGAHGRPLRAPGSRAKIRRDVEVKKEGARGSYLPRPEKWRQRNRGRARRFALDK